MKPITKRRKTKTILLIVLVLVFCSSTEKKLLGQNDNRPPLPARGFAPNKDNAVVPVDFKSEFDSHSNTGSTYADLGPESTEATNDRLAQGIKDVGLDLFDKAQPSAWFDNLKTQTENVQFPKVFGSLAIVLGGYLGFVWLTRRFGNGSNHGLPQEVVEVLGHAPFGPKKTLQLVRLGSKLLLLMNSPDGTQSIGEITDPHEVEYLTSLFGGKKNSRSAIAIRKASASSAGSRVGGDLKRILKQLQQSDGDSSSVFEA